MLYLLDANVLISAKNTFYKLNRVPEYWEWLKYHGKQGNIKICQEIYDEVSIGSDDLSKWIKDKTCRKCLLINDSVKPPIIQHILENGYGSNLNDVELERIAKDPFLIAYAFKDESRCIVTAELSKRRAKRQNRRVPDVCEDLGVLCISNWELLDLLDFRTDWNA